MMRILHALRADGPTLGVADPSQVAQWVQEVLHRAQ